ncbi:parkin coregulated gene protein-like [Diretmus argenteus]
MPQQQAFRFTSMSTRKDVGPPSAGAYRERPIRPAGPTTFGRCYQRGDIPVVMEHNRGLPRIKWLKDIKTLDRRHFLPLFFDGMVETAHPYRLYAHQGVIQLLALVGPTELAELVPELIRPIKNALETRNHAIMYDMIELVQVMVKIGEGTVGEGEVGRALVPYYHTILPVFRLFQHKHTVKHGQQDIARLIKETLDMLHKFGGENAFINIKSQIPDYVCIGGFGGGRV